VSDRRLDHALSLLADANQPDNHTLFTLGGSQIEQLRIYLDTLLMWRSRVALIATADPVRLVQHHVIDSLQVAPHLRECASLADIGSGAGFPGVPLAIALPRVKVCVIESRRKKASFLREVRRAARLENVEVVEARAEEITDRLFDAVTSRALGSVPDFLHIASTLLRPNGTAVAMRGPDGQLEAVSDPGFESTPTRVFYRLALGRERVLLLYRRK